VGVAAEHADETRVLLQALALDQPAVVGAAGSVVDDPVAVGALQSEWVVWLRATVETLLQRVRSGHHRPFIDEDLAVTLHRLDQQRHDAYRRVAAVVVDVDGRTVDESAALVLQARERALQQD
jgi:shikimate kinase